MIYLAKVPLPRCPFEQIHVALYSYFPHAVHGERPYVWSIADGGASILMMSAMRPATTCAEIHVEAGMTYSFDLTYKRVRNSGKDHTPVEISSMPELRERIIKFVGDRGGQIGFVRLDKMRAIECRKGEHRVRLPIVDAAGQVYVTDAEKFEALLAGGGPGTGKAYGCGMWRLPELFEPALVSLTRVAA